MKFACIVFFVSATIGNGFVIPPRPHTTTISKRSIHHAFLQPPQKTTKKQTPNNRHTTRRQQLFTTTAKTSNQDNPTTTPIHPELKLFNSLTRTKNPVIPVIPHQISMYTCGPTVYDHAHVGNFRAFLTYDVLKRTLQYFKYSVRHVCNLTDVDDKIIKRCTREKITLKELTRKYEGLFMDDLMALNVRLADVYPRATEHIPEMVEMVQDLEKAGLAYQSDEGSWYFRVAEKEGYGKQLVDLDLDKGSMTRKQQTSSPATSDDATTASSCSPPQSSQQQDADEYDADKVGLRDFALWKATKPDFDRPDATWDTPIGTGRPGWHLECSAMAKKYFGRDNTIDIHCGGIDLKFPHHENEIAQSEGASTDRKTKFCNCWLHNGFVTIGEEKMSKSKGNFLTLRGACPTGEDVRAYRYLIVSSQYRNPLSFTSEAVKASKGALKRMDNVRKLLKDALGDEREVSGSMIDNEENEIVKSVNRDVQNFEMALLDDLSMPRAAASLFGVVKAAETEFKRYKKLPAAQDDHNNINVTLSATLDLVGLRAAQNAINQMDQVFGIFYKVPNVKGDDGVEVDDDDDDGSNDAVIPDDVMELVRSRAVAKDGKDWGLADSLRSQITELGFAVKDIKDGEAVVSRLK